MQRQRLVGILITLLFVSACTIPTVPPDVTPALAPPTILPSESTAASSQPTDTPEPQPVQVGITSWALVDEIPYGFSGTPDRTFFGVVIEPIRIDGQGGELLVSMTPANDLSCTQKFVVLWEFDADVSVVNEGDTISLVLSNLPQGSPSGGLLECYTAAKAGMVYGGEVTTDFSVSTGSHFTFGQTRYAPYQEGKSQYLFVPIDHLGQISLGSGTASFNVSDGSGAAEAPHGNFTISVSAGGVFWYDVAYLYDATPG